MTNETALIVALMGTGHGVGKSFDAAFSSHLREVASELQKKFATQRELADHLGLTQSTISNFLSGKTNAGVQIGFAIAGALGMLIDPTRSTLIPRTSKPWRETPGWDDAVAVARGSFPRVSDLAWQHLGDVSGPPLPSMEPGVLGIIAATWDQSGAGITAKLVAESRERMAREDAAGLEAFVPELPREPDPRPRRGRNSSVSVKR